MGSPQRGALSTPPIVPRQRHAGGGQSPRCQVPTKAAQPWGAQGVPFAGVLPPPPRSGQGSPTSSPLRAPRAQPARAGAQAPCQHIYLRSLLFVVFAPPLNTLADSLQPAVLQQQLLPGSWDDTAILWGWQGKWEPAQMADCPAELAAQPRTGTRLGPRAGASIFSSCALEKARARAHHLTSASIRTISMSFPIIQRAACLWDVFWNSTG